MERLFCAVTPSHAPPQQHTLSCPTEDSRLKQLNPTIQTKVIVYPTDKQLSLNELAQLICEQVHFDDATVLLAESFSGLVALELLRLGKLSSIRHLIFCASFTTTPRPWLLKIALKLPLNTLLKIPTPSFLLRRFGLSKQTGQSVIKPIQQAILKVNPRTLVHRMRIIVEAHPITYSVPKERRSHIPCLYLQAEEDKLVPKLHANLFRQYFSNVNIYSIPQAGHFLLQNQPKVCAGIINKLLVQ